MKTKHLFLMMIAAALAIAFTNCSGDDSPASEPELSLSVAPESISAPAATGTHAIAVASNTDWTAVSDNTSWCTVTPPAGNSNGVVTVTVTENTATAGRTATVTIAAGELTRTVAVTQNGATPPPPSVSTPPQAASTRTWTFGGSPLIWSDAIHLSACMYKTKFQWSYSSTCRNCSEDGNTWYYYNWAYVNANAAALCPEPWRVPTSADFAALIEHTSGPALFTAWGYGGYVTSHVFYEDLGSFHWTSTPLATNNNFAHYLLNDSGSVGFVSDAADKNSGFRIRCVQ